MKKFLAPVAVVVLMLSGCGGSNEPTLGQICNSEGEHANTNGVELLCKKQDGDGKLVWEAWSEGGTQGGAVSLAQSLGINQCDSSLTADKYSASIGDVSKFDNIYPMGGMISSHVTPIDHIYVNYPENSQTHSVAKGSYLVTSPADGVISVIEDFQKTNGYPYPDFRVVIEHSCNLFTVFIHVGELADGISLGSKVMAGQTIADDSYSPGYDFSTFDGTKQLTFANPASYAKQDAWKIYTANPFNYFPAETKALLEAKSLRASAPFDGKINWDKEGTVLGNWFVKDTNGYFGNFDNQNANYDNHGKIAHGYWDTHLAIAPDAVDNSAFIYSVGDFDGCPCQFMSPDNFNPETIKAGAEPTVVVLVEPQNQNADGSKFDPQHPKKGYLVKPTSTIAGLLAIQLQPDGTLKVEKLPGVKDPAKFTGFSDKALIYVR